MHSCSCNWGSHCVKCDSYRFTGFRGMAGNRQTDRHAHRWHGLVYCCPFVVCLFEQKLFNSDHPTVLVIYLWCVCVPPVQQWLFISLWSFSIPEEPVQKCPCEWSSICYVSFFQQKLSRSARLTGPSSGPLLADHAPSLLMLCTNLSTLCKLASEYLFGGIYGLTVKIQCIICLLFPATAMHWITF